MTTGRPFHLALFQRLRDWRRSWAQLLSLARNGPSTYFLAKEAITTHKALQRKWEFVALLGMVRRLRPAVVVEVGTYNGGTLYCWSKLAKDSATLVCLDLPGGSWQAGSEEGEKQRLSQFVRPTQTLHCVLADSHAPATRDRVRGLLDGRPVDLLFIDGDHTYEGVRADFELYAPLVRPGGLIAFHDINTMSTPEHQVHRFWPEVRSRYRHYELIDRDGFDVWGGIGVLVQNS